MIPRPPRSTLDRSSAASDVYKRQQQTPEYKIVNREMTLEGYQRIFYLEWAHRLIARIAGLIVVLPLAWFLWRGAIPWRRSAPYLLIGLLFGLQGFLGWWMVASGLLDAPQVSHFRLTIHLLTALLLLALTLWLAFNRIYGQSGLRWRQWSALGALTLAVIVVQIAYGGLGGGPQTRPTPQPRRPACWGGGSWRRGAANE